MHSNGQKPRRTAEAAIANPANGQWLEPCFGSAAKTVWRGLRNPENTGPSIPDLHIMNLASNNILRARR